MNDPMQPECPTRKKRSLPAGHLIAGLLICAAPLVAQRPPPPVPPLPPVPVPAGNPMTPAKAVLGKALFWDEQLSSTNTVACGTCHHTELGGSPAAYALHPGSDDVFGTVDDVRGSPGVMASAPGGGHALHANFGLGAQVTRRAAPPVVNAAYAPLLNWDGRAGTRFLDPVSGAVALPTGGALENQAAGPPVDDIEMAHPGRDWSAVAAKLAGARPLALASALPGDLASALAGGVDYPTLFQRAFGTAQVTPQRILFALATYQRTLIANQTRWDRFNAGDPTALSAAEQRGFAVFSGPGRCAVCHTAPFFTDHSFRNVGLRPVAEDEGRFEQTGNVQDRGRFKVPNLRNVALRGRFMHNGAFTTLDQVVAFYARGGDVRDNQDPVVRGIRIQPQEARDLVAFLGALTDPRVAAGSTPFDRPTLASEGGPANPSFLGGTSLSGFGVPSLLASEPAATGHSGFRLGAAGLPGGAQAWLGLDLGNGTTSHGPFGGLMLGVNPATAWILGPLSAGPDGLVSALLPVPSDPLLVGLNWSTQWVVSDGTSFGATPAAVVSIR